MESNSSSSSSQLRNRGDSVLLGDGSIQQHLSEEHSSLVELQTEQVHRGSLLFGNFKRKASNAVAVVTSSNTNSNSINNSSSNILSSSSSSNSRAQNLRASFNGEIPSSSFPPLHIDETSDQLSTQKVNRENDEWDRALFGNDALADFATEQEYMEELQQEESKTESTARVNVTKQLNIEESYKNVYFNLPRFLYQFVYHSLLPFSLPFYLWKEGFALAQSQLFTHPFWALFQCVQSIFCWLIPVLYATLDDDTRAQISVIEVVIPSLLYLTHKLMVACKYAYMSDQTYLNLHYRKANISKLELLTWLKPPPDVVFVEMMKAARSLGIDVAHIKFHTPNTKAEIHKFLGVVQTCSNPSSVDPSLVTVCVGSTMMRMAQLASENYSLNFWQRRCAVLAHLFAWIPMLVRLGRGHSVFADNSGAAVCLIVFAYLQSSFYFSTCLRFIIVGIVDYVRRYKMLRMCDWLIDPSRHQLTINSNSKDQRELEIRKLLPTVDLSVSENVLSWLALRQLVQQFGLAYRKRVLMYISFLILATAALVIYLFVGTLAGLGITVTTWACLVYEVLVVCTALVVIISYGQFASDQSNVHRGTIVRIQFAVRELTSDSLHRQNPLFKLSINDRNDLMQCDTFLESVLRILDIERTYSSLTVLGLQPITVIRGIFTLAASAVSVGIADQFGARNT